MYFFSVLKQLSGQKPRQSIRPRYRPCVECLEGRILLAHKLGDHIHPFLTIVIDGQNVPIPTDIGITETSHYNPHTHETTGKIHIGEAPEVGINNETRVGTLQDFFDVWRTTNVGKPSNNPSAVFNQFQIMDKVAGREGILTMTVNGQPNTEYEKYSPHDADQIVINYETIEEPPPPPPPPEHPTHTSFNGKLFVVGGSDGKIQVLRSSDGTVQADFAPYGAAYDGRVSVAVGDVNGDGVEDLVTGAAVGSPHVKVFDGQAIKNATFQENNPDAHVLVSWMAYETRFNVGVNVAVGKISGSESMDIVTGATAGNPHVKVYRGSAIAERTFATNPEAYVMASYFAYGLNINLGTTVAVGAVSGSDNADVVTGSTGGNPHVKIYRGEALANGGLTDPEAILVSSFIAFDSGQNIGANVAVGDTNADTFADVIVGSSLGNAHVKTFSGKSLSEGLAGVSAVDEFFAYDMNAGTGVTVGAADFDGDGDVEIITGAAQGSANYRVVKANSSGVKPSAVMEGVIDDLRGGISVGG